MDELDFMTELIEEAGRSSNCLFCGKLDYHFDIDLSKEFDDIFSKTEIAIQCLNFVEITSMMNLFQIVQNKKVII